MRVVYLGRDLMMGSRIAAAADAMGAEFLRIDAPSQLPDPRTVARVYVDWSEREETWGPAVRAWCQDAPDTSGPRVVLFGRHTDLEAHQAARLAGLGPMLARSKLVADLASNPS